MINTVLKRENDLSVLDDFESLFLNRFYNNHYEPKVDIHEDEQNLYISADLAGVDKKDLSITVENNVLTLSGHKQTVDKKDIDGYSSFERLSGSFKRSFNLGTRFDLNSIEAELNKGVLSIQLSKKEELKAKSIDVKIK